MPTQSACHMVAQHWTTTFLITWDVICSGPSRGLSTLAGASVNVSAGTGAGADQGKLQVTLTSATVEYIVQEEACASKHAAKTFVH